MTRDEATKLLGLLPEETKSPQSVKAAYSRAVRQAHPDTCDPLQPVTTRNIKDIMKARDILLARIAEKPCAQCGGRGRVPGRMGGQTCAACKGTGESTL